MKIKYNPIDVARMYLFVRELSVQNTGNRVESIQKWCGGLKGESYCCYFVTMVLDICFQGNSPIPRNGSCESVRQLCIKNAYMTKTPKAGDIFFYVGSNGLAHHIGFVTADGGTPGIAGNTSEDGTSSNGTGVFEHAISTNPKTVQYASYPR